MAKPIEVRHAGGGRPATIWEMSRVTEDEMVQHLLENSAEDVHDYALEQGVDKMQAAEEMVEGIVMSGQTKEIKQVSRYRLH